VNSIFSLSYWAHTLTFVKLRALTTPYTPPLYSDMIDDNPLKDSNITMLQTSNPHVTLVFVLNFDALDPQVRFKQGEAEKAFSHLINSQSQQTNVADGADPNAPRIFFPSSHKAIAISQLACQLTQNLLPAGGTFVQQITAAHDNILAFVDGARQFKSVFSSHALILDLRYPCSNSSSEVAEFIHSRFLKSEPLGGFASTVLQMGYTVGNLYLTLTINPYEARKMPETVSRDAFVRADTLAVVESGVQIRVDVNNKLGLGGGANQGTVHQLISALDTFMNEKFAPISGFSIPVGVI
jgi:hypothetical protein